MMSNLDDALRLLYCLAWTITSEAELSPDGQLRAVVSEQLLTELDCACAQVFRLLPPEAQDPMPEDRL